MKLAMPRAVLFPLLLLAATLSACRHGISEELLAGTWLCTAAPPDYAMERTVTYSEEGELSGRIALQSNDRKEPVGMEITFKGTWTLTGDVLTEEIESQRLMRFARAGKDVPLGELPAGFVTRVESTLATRSADFKIDELSEKELFQHDMAAGVETTCKRPEKS